MTTDSIELRFAHFDEVEISKKEALRYMGYNRNSALDNVEELFLACMNEFQSAVSYKACFTKTKINFLGNGRLDLGFGEFESYHLEKNLQGCKEAFVFAATCGIAPDRLVMRYANTQPSKSVIIDSIGSAAVEDWCNKINDEMSLSGKTKPRFSCGYGDFKLTEQKNILEFLDAYRKIGISLSDSLLMTPKKSVTAIVGLQTAEV